MSDGNENYENYYIAIAVVMTVVAIYLWIKKYKPTEKKLAASLKELADLRKEVLELSEKNSKLLKNASNSLSSDTSLSRTNELQYTLDRFQEVSDQLRDKTDEVLKLKSKLENECKKGGSKSAYKSMMVLLDSAPKEVLLASVAHHSIGASAGVVKMLKLYSQLLEITLKRSDAQFNKMLSKFNSQDFKKIINKVCSEIERELNNDWDKVQLFLRNDIIGKNLSIDKTMQQLSREKMITERELSIMKETVDVTAVEITNLLKYACSNRNTGEDLNKLFNRSLMSIRSIYRRNMNIIAVGVMSSVSEAVKFGRM